MEMKEDMNIERIKEDLSICYLKAIAAIYGIALEEIRHDEDSIDVMIKKWVKPESGMLYNSQISIQLKATSSFSQYSISEDEIIYKLKVKNYNDLCAQSSMPSILCLLILPSDEENWVNWKEDELLLKGEMFWLCLQGMDLSNNSSSISVRIPKMNRINKDTLEKLLIRAAEEGRL